MTTTSTVLKKDSPVTLEDILLARDRLRPVALRTPLLRQLHFEGERGTEVHIKAENFQRTGAFKFRGGFNVLSCLRETENPRHVVTSSSGNHGQAVAAAGRLLGVDITVVMPTDAIEAKVDAVRGFGATAEFAGTTSLEREARAQEIAAKTGAVVIGSFDDARIIAGQGTAGVEIVEDLPDVDLVLVPVGGGGLISGIATAVKSMIPTCRVVGVEPEGAADAQASLDRGEIVTLDRINTICDGLRTSHIGTLNFAIMSRLVDGIVTVTDEEVKQAMRRLAFESKLTVEPSGAVAVAALLAGKVETEGRRIAVIVSGGNADPAAFSAILAG